MSKLIVHVDIWKRVYWTNRQEFPDVDAAREYAKKQGYSKVSIKFDDFEGKGNPIVSGTDRYNLARTIAMKNGKFPKARSDNKSKTTSLTQGSING